MAEERSCPACIVNHIPPPEPGDAYIAGVVEQQRGDVLRRLCKRHETMRRAFALVDRMLVEALEEPKEEEKPS